MRTIFLLVLMTVLIAACVPPPPGTAAPPRTIKQPGAPAQPAMLEKIYNYEKINSYVYRSNSYMQNGTPIISIYNQEVRREQVNGVPSIRIEVWADIPSAPEGSRGMSLIWFDAKSDKCLDAESVIMVSGKNSTGSKPSCGPATTYGNPAGGIYPFIDTQTVSVPAGTYQVKRYGIPGAVIYYMAENVPVPVRMDWGSRNATSGIIYELQSIS